MNSMQRPAGLTSCVLLVLTLTAKAQGDVTCTAVTSSSRTTVVCHFGVDISKSNHNFNVQFYFPDFKSDPESALLCNHALGGGFACHSARDVIFNKRTVGDTVTFTRPASLDKVGGQYVCQLLPAVRFHPCQLTSIEPEEDTASQSTEAGARNTDNSALIGMVVLVALLVCLLVFSCVIVSVLLWTKRRRLMKWWSKPDTVEDPAPKDQLNASESPHPQTGDTTEPLLIPPDLSPEGSGQQAKDEKPAAVPEQVLHVHTSAQTDRHQAGPSTQTADAEVNKTPPADAGRKSRISGVKPDKAVTGDIDSGDALLSEEDAVPVMYVVPSALQGPRGTIEPRRTPQVELQPLDPEPGEQEATFHDILEELDASSPMLKETRFESEAERREADKNFKQQQTDELNQFLQDQKDEMQRVEQRLTAENKSWFERKKKKKKLETQQKKEMEDFEKQQTTKKKQWEKYQQAESKRLSK